MRALADPAAFPEAPTAGPTNPRPPGSYGDRRGSSARTNAERMRGHTLPCLARRTRRTLARRDTNSIRM